MSTLAWSPGHLHIAGASSPDPQRHRPLVDNVKSMHILGLSAFYHDSAACLLRDGEIVAAAQEERFTRKKGDAAFPRLAVDYCLQAGGIAVKDLALVGFYDKPLLKFERILETYLGIAPRGFRSFLMAGPLWIKEKLFTDRAAAGRAGVSTARSCTTRAPRVARRERILSVAVRGGRDPDDGRRGRVGHRIVRCRARATTCEILREIHWPDSLGLLYSAFTYYTGFKVNSGEYKVMGLAPYGEPKYVDLIYRRADRPQGRRLVHAQSAVLQLPDRADDDEQRVRPAVRRPAA